MTVAYVLAAVLLVAVAVRQLRRANGKVNAALKDIKHPPPARTTDPAQKENNAA